MGLAIFDIKVELPRASKRNPHPRYTQAQGLAVGLAAQLRREAHKSPKPYHYDTGAGYFVAAGYPPNPSGKNTRYPNSAAAHAAMGVAKSGSFNVSGGMWRGLSVLQHGRSKATITFRGRSTGARIQKRTNKRSGKVTYKTLKVSNALKAATVLKAAHRNILEPSRADLDALREVVERGALGLVQGGLGLEVEVGRESPLSPAARLIASASRRVQP